MCALHVDPISGKVIPGGRTPKEEYEPFMGANVLPYWMTVTGSTAATPAQFLPSNTSSVGFQLNVANVVNEKATINLFPVGLHCSNGSGGHKRLRVELQSMSFSADYQHLQFIFEFVSATGNNGFVIVFGGDSNGPTCVITARNNNTPTNFAFDKYQLFNDNEHSRRRNLTFTVDIKNRSIAFGEGDDIQFEKEYSGAQVQMNEPMFCKVSIKNIKATSPAAQFMKLGGIRVIAETN